MLKISKKSHCALLMYLEHPLNSVCETGRPRSIIVKSMRRKGMFLKGRKRYSVFSKIANGRWKIYFNAGGISPQQVPLDSWRSEQEAEIANFMYIPRSIALLSPNNYMAWSLGAFKSLWLDKPTCLYVFSFWSLHETYMTLHSMLITLSNCIPTHV